MRKLLSASFFRLLKSKVFWLLSGILFFWGVLAYVIMYINTEIYGIIVTGWNSYFFNGNLCIGPALAVFVSFFIGTEYSDGGFQNRLAVGHRRIPIYLSNLISCCAAGILFLTAFWLGALTGGLPIAGVAMITQLEKPVLGILCSCVVAVSYSALFCLVAMLDSNKARSATIGLLLAVFLYLGGFATYTGLSEPEFITRMVTNADGEYEIAETIPNSKYLSDTERVIYECIDAVLPSCHALRPILTDTDYPISMPLGAFGWTATLTLCGIQLFRRKDIR